MALCILAGMVAFAPAAQSCEAWPRKTLALYDSTREREPRDTRIHRFAELALNHLGQVVVYHDVAGGAPPQVDPAEVALVMSWLDTPATRMQGMEDWLAQRDLFCNGGPKMVAFGELAPWLALRGDVAGMALASMGVATDQVTYAVGVSATITDKDEDLIDHEANFLGRPGDYSGITAAADGQPLLRLSSQGKDIDLAVLGPAGGYVHPDAAVRTDAPGEALWILDPLEFFERVLRDDQVPKPDPTTVQGMRAFFATVSSVGWLDVTPARVFGEAERLASEDLVERLVEPFADLPMSIAVLAGDLVPELGGPSAERGRQAALRAFAAANVEGAAQGFSDIRDWGFFAAYDKDREAALLDVAEVEDQGALVSSAVQTLRDTFAETGASTFSHTPGAPRKYATAPFDLGQEITGAIAQVNGMSPDQRPVQLYAWSGNARPFEAALQAEAATGVLGMGGGGGVMTADKASLTGLWPVSAQVGAQAQIYDALSGDAFYTGYWTAPLYGFHGFAETLRRTEEPRRLKPFHLSFAARSAIHFETRRAIEDYLDLARTSEVTPVRASAYAAAAQGFLSARIVPEGIDAWRIHDRGALQTVRLDHAADRAVDMARSEGVMGARRKGDSLYVALAPSVEAPLVALTTDAGDSGIVLGSSAPALSQSRVIVESWSRGPCSVELEASGFAEGDLVLWGPPGARYEVAMSDIDEGRRQDHTADEAGFLTIRVPTAPGGLLGVSVLGSC